jgi:hypothetical protein
VSHPGSALNALSVYSARSAAGLGGGQGQVCCGICAHPATSRIDGHTMWVVYLEMLVALAIIAAIVWLTWPRKPK